jgi:ribosomal protein S3AE
MAAKQSKAAILVKKKVWLPIIAPALFNNQPIGEMYVDEEQSPVGRRVTVSLMVLTNDPQRQNVHMSFEVTKVENRQLHTRIHGYSIVPVAVRKMMRRGRERVDESFVVKTQDSVVVRAKPVLITRGRAKGGVLADLRRQLRMNVARAIAKLTFIDLMKEMVAHKIQRELQESLRKIYPLQVCELRDVHIEAGEKALKKIVVAPPLAEKPKTEQPAEEAPAPQEPPPAEQPTEGV